MAGSGSFTVSRNHGGDRFYNPPAIRRHNQQMLLQQQQQIRMRQNQHQPQRSQSDRQNEVDDSTVLDDSTFSKPSEILPSPSSLTTNLDRLMDSVTPFVPAHYFPECGVMGRRNREGELQAFFSLEDLWETFKEWSMYGVGVPLLLSGKDSVMQYYVPFLSGIQLYVDPSVILSKMRNDNELSRETSSNTMNLNFQHFNELSLSDKILTCDQTGQLVFEYLEYEQPHHRKPLTDKISSLASQFPDLRNYRSCDLSSSSWLSVAWYPIYRIPVGSTLQNLDASFLSFHSLSTQSKGRGQPQIHSLSSRMTNGVDASSKFSLPVFGLACYKLKGSILTSSGEHEIQQESGLMEAVGNWMGRLQVDLPDYRFFRSHHNSQWR